MDFSKVTHFLDSLHSVGIPGADLAIYMKGKEVYRHQTGFSDLESKTALRSDNLYLMYSMTKVVTCVAALRFFEEGRYKLGDALSDYIPVFKQMNVQRTQGNGAVTITPAVNPIRIVDLFTMSSGLTYNWTDGLVELDKKSKDNFTLREFTEAIAKDPLFFEPGTHWHYGFSHDILGYLIEVLSGKTLGEYFHDEIFAPLGMKETFFRLPPDKKHRLASCYEYDEKTGHHKKIDKFPLRFDPDCTYESGGGGLLSTVDDYAKFANALSGGGTGANGYRLLGKATIDLMRENHLDDVRMKDYSGPIPNGYGYGLGVRTMVDRAAGGSNSSLGEFGWAGMAGTYLLMDPAVDLTYVYAQQLMPSKEAYVAPRLRNVVYGCL